MKGKGVRAVVTGFAFLAMVNAGTAQTTEDRLSQLEKEIAELKNEQSDASLTDGVHLGGYGELHYNNLSGNGGASDVESIDFHRFVIFVGYDFSDRMRFNSELELEHSLSGDGKPGEVELEQAYVDFDLNDAHTIRGGLFLLPIGILNETHEPTTFYGVERNAVEKNIIPTTWWEAGAGAHGRLQGGVSYAAYVHSGLMTSTNESYSLRSGRQKAAEAQASDLAGTLAVKWQAPGITVGGALNYQSDISQGVDGDTGEGILGEIHTDIRKGAFGVRALYAYWSLNGNGPDTYGADEQYGWYVEPSFRPLESVGLFARYSEWDNAAGNSDTDSKKIQYDVGINWWPHAQVVVKADYQRQENESGKDQSGFNLGIGYDF